MNNLEMKDRLIFALDVSDINEAKRLVRKLNGVISFFKVGIILQIASGLEIVKWLIKKKKEVFLDLKYFDVPETVGRAIERVTNLGVSFLTMHGNSEIVKEAVRARGDSKLKLFAVTVLTSLDVSDIHNLGIKCSLKELVLYRAKKAIEYGCDGVIASVHEVRDIRKAIGDEQLIVVTPGIRTKEDAMNDHKRSATPKEAIEAGADYLVVGRPIRKALNPREKAIKIIEEMTSALKSNPSRKTPSYIDYGVAESEFYRILKKASQPIRGIKFDSKKSGT